MKKIFANWYIWMFPLIAVVLTAWLIFGYYHQAGTEISILFADASGIESEKTKIRFRGIEVGTVKSLKLAEDDNGVVVTALLDKPYGDMAVRGSRFSLVKPKVNFQGVSGLDTLFAGTYIAVLPGVSSDKTESQFNAEATSLTTPLDDTSVYYVGAENVDAVNPGDSVTYRGVKIGSVTDLSFSKGAQAVLVQLNVENQYAYLIRQNTVFWRKMAVRADLGLFSSEIQVSSLDSIMNGGIEIATPTAAQPMAKNASHFTLSQEPPEKYKEWKPVLD